MYTWGSHMFLFESEVYYDGFYIFLYSQGRNIANFYYDGKI
jgi:hypothetical protein